MRAVSRLGVLFSAGAALALAPAAALAQEVPATTTNTPAADSIGPQTLQNFSLKGTVTRAADQPAVAAPAQKRPPKAQSQVASPAVEPSASLTDATAAQSTPDATAPAPRRTETASAAPVRQQPQPTPDRSQQPATSSSSSPAALPNVVANITPSNAAPVAPAGFAPAPATPDTLAPEHGFPFLPWLLAVLALALGGGFLFWRNRERHSYAGAGGPQVDAFVAPQPRPAAPVRTPQPAPQPAPAPAPQPKPSDGVPLGIVSTRLRPWIDIGFHPLRCVLDNERLTVEFEIELFNSGSAPARAVLVEASLFNAGPLQEQEIGNFFANPVGQGERIDTMPPLKRLGFKTQIGIPREQVRAYDMAGRQVFVPLIAFNVLYTSGSSEAQTSAAYMLGRDTKGDKMAPFRVDLGPHIFRNVAGRLLPGGVRR